MKDSSSTHIADVQRLWDRYVLQDQPMGECPEEISPVVWDSWKRSKESGVDAFYPADVIMEKEALSDALEKNRDLLEIMVPYTESLYRNMIGSNHLFQMVSSEGCILKTFTTDRKILDIIYDNSLILLDGAVVTEEAIGTNSSGLCVKLQKPVEIIGTEHFQKYNHRFCCVSAPIFDETQFRGCLTLMCPLEDYQSFAPGLIKATVDLIQKELQLRKAWEETSKSNRTLHKILELYSGGVLLMNKERQILYHNRNAADYLNLSAASLLDKNFYDLVKIESLPEVLRTLNGGFPMTPITVTNINGERCELTAQLIPIEARMDEKDYILNFQPLQQTYSLINAVGGSRAAYTFDSIIGKSELIRKTVSQGRHAAQSDSTVLIQGQSGTGKELMAQAIHNASARAKGPFVAINCGSIPKELIASELFGYEGGAFTGANRSGNPGKFELADGGTLFLDEIGDMPFDLQVSLLRVLENGEISRLGSKTPRKINVRIIAATNRDLRERIKRKAFRADLYYRLNVLNITLPPLRERTSDIMQLAIHFLRRYSRNMHKEDMNISDEAMQALMAYPWPGNIRELENVIERAANFASTEEITLQDLPEDIIHPSEKTQAVRVRQKIDTDENRGQSAEYVQLKELLRKHGGNIKSIAEETGIPASTLYSKLTRYHLRAKDYKGL